MIKESTLPNGQLVRFDEEDHTYDLYAGKDTATGEDEWFRVPSVTTILGVFHKPALVWWGMQIGVKGLLELQCLAEQDRDGKLVELITDSHGLLDLDEGELVALLTEYKLTVNHVKKKAGDRGKAVHKVAENHAQGISVPAFGAFPDEERGYVEAFNQFVIEKAPKYRNTEIVVASWDSGGWAGTLDVLAEIEGELWLLDYKTSKRVYETHFAQLAFYREGLLLSQYITGVEYYDLRQGVVLLQENGKYKIVENNHVGPDHVKMLIDGYNGYKALKPPKKKRGKK